MIHGTVGSRHRLFHIVSESPLATNRGWRPRKVAQARMQRNYALESKGRMLVSGSKPKHGKHSIFSPVSRSPFVPMEGRYASCSTGRCR